MDTRIHISPKKALYAGPIITKADGENGSSEWLTKEHLAGNADHQCANNHQRTQMLASKRQGEGFYLKAETYVLG
jgi:hypothetical protein